MKSEPNYVSVAEAAKVMGMHPRYVRRLCAAEKLGCIRVGKVFLVIKKSAEAYKRDPFGRGRPRKDEG
jgi:excisionase family DNA binding protein